MRTPFFTTCRVSPVFEEVTTVRADAEVNPRDVGVDPTAVGRIWHAVEQLYRSGIHPAMQLCVRRRGQVLIDRAIGHASGNGPGDLPDAPKVLATPDTPFNIFSASKAVTAMIIHLLDQRHLIHLDDPVCEYIPEFGVRKKQWITLRHVLTHRAGIPNLPPGSMELDRLADPLGIVQLLCDTEPEWRPGRRLAYHAISGGFLLGGVVRRVTGRDIKRFLDDEIRKPLGLRWLSYGVRPREVKQVAVNYFTGLPAVFPLSTLLQRALGVDFYAATDLSNDPRFLLGVVPAGNIVTTANELTRFYQLLLNGGALDGVRLFEPRTIRRATSEQSYFEVDFTLGLPLRYGMGFMLGGKTFSLYGPDTQYSFGHLGFTNVISWADPERQVAGTLMTSGKPLLYPALYHAWDMMRQIGVACPKGGVPGSKGSRAPGVKAPKRSNRRARPRAGKRVPAAVLREPAISQGNGSGPLGPPNP